SHHQEASMTQPTRRLVVGLGLAAMAIVVLATLFIRPSSSATTYLVVDVATIDQGSSVVVRGPNVAGDAVGGGRVAGARRGLLFTRGGLQEISGLSGSDYTTVFGINHVGDTVGSSNTADALRAFRNTRAGAIGELPPLAGDTASVAFAVNKRGEAVGFTSGQGGEQAVLWAADNSGTVLPGAAGAPGRRAVGVNGGGGPGCAANTRAGVGGSLL